MVSFRWNIKDDACYNGKILFKIKIKKSADAMTHNQVIKTLPDFRVNLQKEEKNY